MRIVRFVIASLASAVVLFSIPSTYADSDYGASSPFDTLAQNQEPADNYTYLLSPNSIYKGFYLGIAGGVSLNALQNSTLLTCTDRNNNLISYNFNNNKKYNPNLLVGINGGYEFQLTPHLLIDLGIASYGFSSGIGKTSVDGKLVENYSNGQTQYDTNAWNYSYTISSLQLMFETKVKYQIKRFFPFVTLGIGPVWNKLEQYAIQSSPEDLKHIDSFNGSCKKISFAYKLGLGIDYRLFDNNYNHYIGISYNFTNLGNMNFSVSQDQTKLGTGTFITHNILVRYTYHF